MGDFDFMNNPDFGAPGGVRANQAAMMNELSMQGAQADLAMMPDKQAYMRAQTEHLKAQTGEIPSQIELRKAQASKAPAEIMKLWSEVGENIADAGAKEYATQEAKALKEAMIRASQGGQFAVGEDGKPMSNAKSIASIGMKLLAEGFTVPAEKLLNQANLMAGHDTSQDRLLFDKRTAELDQDLKIAQLVGHRTPWITNQKQLDDLNTEITRITGKAPAWTGVPYSPETVQRLEAFALKAGERANFQLKEEKALADQRNRDIQNSLRELDIRIREAEHQRRKWKDEQDKKAGVVAPAGTSEVDAVTQMAIQQNPKLKGLTGPDAAAFDMFARSVADEAKKIYKQHGRALTPEQARFKALTNNMEQLTVAGTWSGGTTVQYESKGIGTPSTPIPFAADTERKADKWYTVNGRVVQWTKNPATGQMGWKAAE